MAFVFTPSRVVSCIVVSSMPPCLSTSTLVPYVARSRVLERVNKGGYGRRRASREEGGSTYGVVEARQWP